MTRLRLLNRLHGIWFVLLQLAGALALIATIILALQAFGYTPTPEWCTDRWVARCTEHRPLNECRTDQRALGCKEK